LYGVRRSTHYVVAPKPGASMGAFLKLCGPRDLNLSRSLASSNLQFCNCTFMENPMDVLQLHCKIGFNTPDERVEIFDLPARYSNLEYPGDAVDDEGDPPPPP
jgi:hypothetical protein